MAPSASTGRPTTSPDNDRSTVLTVLRVLVPFTAGYFLSYLFRTVNSVIAPDLVDAAGLDAADLGLLTSVYFLFFALGQIPYGMALDRFGPRRVAAFVITFAGIGALVFAHSSSLTGLLIGRGLIGLGVGICLMASFKALAMWFRPEKLPIVNGVFVATGGLGALAATAPVEALLGYTDWRGLFIGLGVITLIVAASIFLFVPRRGEDALADVPRTGLLEQIAQLKPVYVSRLFWAISPLTALSQAALFALMGLWAGPWLRDVAGLDRIGVANHLLAITVGMIAGYLTLGAIAERLSHWGIRPVMVSAVGMLLFALIQVALCFEPVSIALPLWIAFGYLGSSGLLPYAVLSQHFGPKLTARANTGINFLVFVAAFIAQFGIGAIIGLWPETADGGYAPVAYQAAFGTVAALQILALLWYLLIRPRETEA